MAFNTREILERLGHRPRRKLGQNFLTDPNIVRKSLELARVEPNDTIIEIGPGLGVLTEALLGTGATVFAVEYDEELYDYLRGEFSETRPAARERLHLLHADCVDHPAAGLPAAAEAWEKAKRDGYKVVANLPYAVSSPWLEALLGLADSAGAEVLPRVMVLMLQKEAADRYTAEHGSKSFGAISVFLQSAYIKRPGHSVSRNCFHPAPDVSSTLLHLELTENPVVFPPARRRLIRDLFNKRRKQIGNLARNRDELKPWLGWVERNGISLSARPEAIPLEAWQQLAGE